MRLASALLAVTAAISLAVPAHADPNDTDFLTALKQAGISFADNDKAIAAGKSVCDGLDHGQSAADVVKNLTDSNPGFPPSGAAKFTAIASAAYCPKYLGSGTG